MNTYALFSETIASLTSPTGRSGFIVPMGIATDDTTKAFFASLISQRRLAQLIGLFEIRAWFPATDDRKAFCLLTLGKAEKSRFIFDVKAIEDLQQDAKWIELPPEDLILINPNTRTCPIFRARADAELTRAIYRRVPVLIEEARDEQPEKNPWGIRFGTMFHMSNDSGLFENQPRSDLLPLYEAKMIHQFDHRWASYTRTPDGELDTANVTEAEKANPDFTLGPRYWVPRSAVEEALLNKQDPLYPLHLAAKENRRDSLAWWFRCWLWGHELVAGHNENAGQLRQEMDDARIISHDIMEIVMAHEPERIWAKRAANAFPITDDEQNQLWHQIKADDGLISRDPRILGRKNSDQLSEAWEQIAETILTKRRRQWLIGWRRNARNTDERSMIACAMPANGIGDSIFLLSTTQPSHLAAALLANCDVLSFDFVMRQKLAGSNLSFYYIKQLPILPPETYSEADLAYIVPRVLELTYTTHDMRPWAEDVIVSYQCQFPQHPPLVPDLSDLAPFAFDPIRRAQLRAELDARYARLYALTRDELRYILDPADTHGPDYPTETFRVLKTNELKQFGEYRTRRLVLEAWDLQAAYDGKLPEVPRTAFAGQDYFELVLPLLLRMAPEGLERARLFHAIELLTDPAKRTKAARNLGDIGTQWAQAFRETYSFADAGKALITEVTKGRISGVERMRLDPQAAVTTSNPWLCVDAFLALRLALEAEVHAVQASEKSQQALVEQITRFTQVA